jgi:predicted dehydrogenase
MSLAKNAVCIAVASRSKPRAEKYAAENGNIPKAYGSYEDLLADPEIDAVYIPLPTSVRKEWVLKAAAAGKHVLAEKPVGGTLADVQEMVEACAKNRVLLMVSVWPSRLAPAFPFPGTLSASRCEPPCAQTIDPGAGGQH